MAQNEETRPGLMVSPLHGERARKKAVSTGRKLKVHCAEIEAHTTSTKEKQNKSCETP